MKLTDTTLFVGREEEVTALQRLHAQPGSQVAVVYGRRRIGKTALIQHAFAQSVLLSFEGVENKNKR